MKKKFEDEGSLFVSRSRGSFGSFDLMVFYDTHLHLVSVKSTRQKYWSPKKEIEKLSKIKVPDYCLKSLWIWWSPHPEREKRGWECIPVE